MDRVPFNKLFTKSVPHILEKIFLSLDYASFKKCKEVNRVWHELLTSKSFKEIGKSTFFEEIKAHLWHAVRLGNANEVREVLSTGMANIECIDEYKNRGNMTPLFVAVDKGHKNVVQLLLEGGANPNSQVSKFQNWTPLFVAAWRDNFDVLELLLEAGGKVNMETRDGRIPLHYAKDRRVAELLLDKGSHLHKEDVLRYTPLHYATSAGHTDVVEFLLERGADPNRPNRMGETPLHIISFYIGRLGQGDVKLIAKLLIDNGADVNMVADNGHTPLWFALKMKHTEVADLIREHGGVE